MENYEKKYKEALESIKKIRDANKCNTALVESIEYFFPELAESEDEKIRKAIVEHLQYDIDDMTKSDNPFDYETKIEELSKYIAWLEKQGKQKQVEWSNEDKKMRDLLIKQLAALKCAFGLDFKDAITWLKSLKPQSHWKPTEYQILLLEEIARNIRNNVRPFCSEVASLEDLTKQLKSL